MTVLMKNLSVSLFVRDTLVVLLKVNIDMVYMRVWYCPYSG